MVWDKKLSLEVDSIGWNSISKKKYVISVLFIYQSKVFTAALAKIDYMIYLNHVQCISKTKQSYKIVFIGKIISYQLDFKAQIPK